MVFLASFCRHRSDDARPLLERNWQWWSCTSSMGTPIINSKSIEQLNVCVISFFLSIFLSFFLIVIYLQISNLSYCFTYSLPYWAHSYLLLKMLFVRYCSIQASLHSLLEVRHLIPHFFLDCMFSCSSQTLFDNLLKRLIVPREKITEWHPMMSPLFAPSCNSINQ
jgi:hypothetical protein